MQRSGRFPLQSIPFIRLFVPFALGILLGEAYVPSIPLSAAILIISLLIQPLFSLLTVHQRFRFAWFGGLLVGLLMFCFGVFVQRNYDARTNPHFPASEEILARHKIIARVTSVPEKKNRFYRFVATMETAFNDNHHMLVDAELIVYLSIGQGEPIPSVGQRILFSITPQRIRSTSNPGMFNYAAYAAKQNIFYQVFLPSSSYLILPADADPGFNRWIENTRRHTINILKSFIPDKISAGMAEALLIGYKSDLDSGLSQAYSNTGLAHVVAISGLHLGLIYWILSVCLGLINKKGLRWLYAALMLCGLWSFSILAGAGPSIIRSAVMFTCFLVGKTFNRRNIVLNALAASAFLLLCYNPSWLWDVGFQLSYAAVLSLIIFMKPIYLSFSLHNRALDGLWQMCAVTLAAQVLTLPLTIFYFHQVPVLFVFTNIVAVPLSTIVVFCLVALCVLAWLNPVARMVGLISDLLIRWMNGFVQYMNDYPFSQITNIWITAGEAALIFPVIIFATAFARAPGTGRLRLVICSLVVLAFTIVLEISMHRVTERMIVYNVPRALVIDFFHLGKVKSIDHDASKDVIQKYVESTRRLWRATAVASESLEDGTSEVSFCSRRIIIVGKTGSLPDDIAGAVIILHQNPRFEFTSSMKKLEVMVIADGANSRKMIDEWRRSADSLQIPFQAVAVDGPWIWESERDGD